MPIPAVKSGIKNVQRFIIAETIAAFEANGYTPGGEYVFTVARPYNDLPHAVVVSTNEVPSQVVEDKDCAAVRVFPEATIYALDWATVQDIASDLIERMTVNNPNVQGREVVINRLAQSLPDNIIDGDAPNVYGRAVQFDFHLAIT